MPYKDEGSSSKPVYREEKILVSLSEAIKPQGTDQKNTLKFLHSSTGVNVEILLFQLLWLEVPLL